jgi:hypothetical protein
MHAYCGFSIFSNIAIPELPSTPGDQGSFWFSLETGSTPGPDPDWLHHWLSPREEKLLSYGRTYSHHLLRFPDIADFILSPNARKISCYPRRIILESTVRHLLLDQVLPRCLAYRRKLMLHASAIMLGHGLLIFIGDSGTGKSTLAGDFHKAGQPVVADDCLWIVENGELVLAHPTYRGLRLWEDSLDFLFKEKTETQAVADYSSKRRVSFRNSPGDAAEGGAPILALIILSPCHPTARSAISLEPLSYREIFISLHKQSFQLNPTDLERMTRHMRALGRIVPRLKVFRLSLPHDYALLPLVRQKILDAVL